MSVIPRDLPLPPIKPCPEFSRLAIFSHHIPQNTAGGYPPLEKIVMGGQPHPPYCIIIGFRPEICMSVVGPHHRPLSPPDHHKPDTAACGQEWRTGHGNDAGTKYNVLKA
jgi:hypothetical protein